MGYYFCAGTVRVHLHTDRWAHMWLCKNRKRLNYWYWISTQKRFSFDRKVLRIMFPRHSAYTYNANFTGPGLFWSNFLPLHFETLTTSFLSFSVAILQDRKNNLFSSVEDPAFFDTGGIRIRDLRWTSQIIPRVLKQFLGSTILQFFDADPEYFLPWIQDPGWKIRIRD